MITKGLLVWLSLLSQNWAEIKNNEIIPQTQEKIHETFSENQKSNKENTVSSEEFLELLQDNIKQQVVQWTIVYFENDVTFSLTSTEKQQLKKDLDSYLKKYPNVITINWTKVSLNLTNENFKKLFEVLLPYLAKWKELRLYIGIFDVGVDEILERVTKAKWKNAEKYFFHQFGYLVMRIVQELQWDMTIWEYTEWMLKVIPNETIKKNKANGKYDRILNLSIKELPKYF